MIHLTLCVLVVVVVFEDDSALQVGLDLVFPPIQYRGEGQSPK